MTDTTDEQLPWRFANPLDSLDVDDDNRDAWELAQSWMNEFRITGDTPRWGLLISGEPGVGKSYLAGALAHDALKVGIDARFISVPDFRTLHTRLMELGDVIGKLTTLNDETPELIEQRIRRQRLWGYRNECDLLVLDDLGAELVSTSGRWIEGEIDALLRHRGDRGKATVITTNLKTGVRVKRYGAPLDSYLREVTTMVQITGEDRRRAEG